MEAKDRLFTGATMATLTTLIDPGLAAIASHAYSR
jgi:hypothetical protein